MSTVLCQRPARASVAAAFMILITPSSAQPHRDTMDGPVVIAAKKTLEPDDVNPVPIWVQEKGEQAIREAFRRMIAVRSMNPETHAFADMYVVETLDRILRAGEGVAYVRFIHSLEGLHTALMKTARDHLHTPSPSESHHNDH